MALPPIQVMEHDKGLCYQRTCNLFVRTKHQILP